MLKQCINNSMCPQGFFSYRTFFVWIGQSANHGLSSHLGNRRILFIETKVLFHVTQSHRPTLFYYILLCHFGPVTAVKSKSETYASLLVEKTPPFPWTFALILSTFLLESMDHASSLKTSAFFLQMRTSIHSTLGLNRISVLVPVL